MSKLSFYFKDRIDRELHDLQREPGERNNLSHEPNFREIKQELLEKLLSWQIRIQQPKVVIDDREDYSPWCWYDYLVII